MRVGKKHTKGLEVKKTRSCVVRLEKFSTPSSKVSFSPEENRNRASTNRINLAAMGPTAKGRKGGTSSQREDKAISGIMKKKNVGGSTSTHSSVQTPPQQKTTNMSNIKSNQKVKIISRSNKTTPASTPSREETPPPTIAAGRSRRAIKPNPKYAGKDMVTPKVLRNVGLFGSSASRGGTSGQSRTRKPSTSSDDFYNRNSEDDSDNGSNYPNDDDDNDLKNDKAYQASEKDDHDSDFSVIEETVMRSSRVRGRTKRMQESIQAKTPQSDIKISSQTQNLKRGNTTIIGNSSNLRSAPSQLQQIRRSLASANAQRNLNLLVGGSNTGQKRKLEEIQDPSDSESNYSVKRKQLLLSNSSGLHKVKLPVRENRANVTSAPLTKSRLISKTPIRKTPTQQTINGSNKINNVLASSRRVMEIATKSSSESFAKSVLRQTSTVTTTNQNNKAINKNSLTTHAKLLSSKTERFRSSSPKQALQKVKQNNGDTVSIASAFSNSTTSATTKSLNMPPTHKPKMSIPAHSSTAINSGIVHEIKDDSPNSTIDDFETMPTFTIVNVNDIINKKGDVLITKSKTNNKTPTVIEFSESISLNDDDEEDDNDINNDDEEVDAIAPVLTQPKQNLSKKFPKLPTLVNKRDFENKKSPLTRSNESLRKLPTRPLNSTSLSNQAPQILNHKLGLRNSRVTAKTTTLTATLTSPDKPAPRILNSVVAKKTQPVKPMIANMEDSADESFPLSLDEDEDEDVEDESEDEVESKNKKGVQMANRGRKRAYQNFMEVDTEDTDSQNTEETDTLLQKTNTAATLSASNITALALKQNTDLQRRRRILDVSNSPNIVSSNKKRLTPAATKENCLAATNKQVNDTTSKQTIASTLPARKSNTEKVVISKQGDKIIKKITCFETWYVINMPVEPKRPALIKNQLEMPLIQLANQAKNICLPSSMWSSKVTLYELSPQSLVKGTFATYTGDLYEHNISEEDRAKYQPSCVMFRRSIGKILVSRMPYDRAVIFKNKTFFTNIEGKNVRLEGAPSIINTEREIEILLEIVDSLTLQSDFVEHISIAQ